MCECSKEPTGVSLWLVGVRLFLVRLRCPSACVCVQIADWVCGGGVCLYAEQSMSCWCQTGQLSSAISHQPGPFDVSRPFFCLASVLAGRKGGRATATCSDMVVINNANKGAGSDWEALPWT